MQRERRKRRSAKKQRRDWCERKGRSRLKQKLLAAGLAPVQLWLPLSKVMQGWMVSERLDVTGEQPAPSMIVGDLEKVVENWADNQIARLKKLGVTK
jgi:hypothetical protein